MTPTVKDSVKPSGKAGTRSRLADLTRFYCVGLVIEGSVHDPDSWERLSRHLRDTLALKPRRSKRGREWDLGFDYEPRKGRHHSVRLRLDPLLKLRLEWYAVGPGGLTRPRRIPPAGTNLTLVVSNDDLQGYMAEAGLYGDPQVIAVADGYSKLAPYDTSELWGYIGPPPAKGERADARGLRLALSTLAAVAPSPVELTVSAAFYFRLRSQWVASWGRKWPQMGAMDVTGVSLCARESGLDLMLRLVDEEDEVKGLFVSLKGVKMESALDAGILDRALKAAFDCVLPFVRVTLKDEKKRVKKAGGAG